MTSTNNSNKRPFLWEAFRFVLTVKAQVELIKLTMPHFHFSIWISYIEPNIRALELENLCGTSLVLFITPVFFLIREVEMSAASNLIKPNLSIITIEDTDLFTLGQSNFCLMCMSRLKWIWNTVLCWIQVSNAFIEHQKRKILTPQNCSINNTALRIVGLHSCKKKWWWHVY